MSLFVSNLSDRQTAWPMKSFNGFIWDVCESTHHICNWSLELCDYILHLLFYLFLPVLTGTCCWGSSTAVLPLRSSRGQLSTCSGPCSTDWTCPARPVWSCHRRVRVRLSVWLLRTAGPSPPSWDAAAGKHSWTCRTVRWRTAGWTCCFLS